MALFRDVNREDQWIEGMVPEGGPWIIRSFRNDSDTVIRPGEAVIRSSDDGRNVNSGNVATDITAGNFMGVAIVDPTVSASDVDTEGMVYRNGVMVPVMMFGPVVVKANAPVLAGAGAHLTADDADGWDDAGAVDVGSFAVFRATVAAGALVILDVGTYPR